MDAGALDAVVLHELLLLFKLLIVASCAVVNAHQLGGQVGHGEEVLVRHVAHEVFDALLRQLDLVLLLVDHKEEFLVRLVHLALVVGEVVAFRLEQLLAHAVLAQKFDEGLALGQSSERAVQGQTTFFHVLLGRPVHEVLLGVRQKPLGRLLLHLDDAHHFGLQLVEFMLVPLGGGAADDQRRPRLVHQHGVHLVHNRKVVLALHQLLRPIRHVVPQVVESKFVVGAKRDVALVGFPARLAVGLVLVDTVHGQTMELVQGTHPFRISTRQVVVDRHHVHAPTGQCIQEHRKRRHQGLALSRLHLGHLASVQGHPTNQLHIVVDHVPGHGCARCGPRLGPKGLVALQPHQISARCNVPVQFRGGHLHFAFCGKSTGRLLDQGKRLRHHLLQNLFQTLVDLELKRIDLFEERFLLVQLAQRKCRGLVLKVFNFFLFTGHMVSDSSAKRI